MNCLKCGCEIKYNGVTYLECYSKIKNDGEFYLISLLDKERCDDIEWLFATKNFGEVSYVENYLIEIDDENEKDKNSALYTGLLKDNSRMAPVRIFLRMELDILESIHQKESLLTE